MNGATRIEAQVGRCSKCGTTHYINDLHTVEAGDSKASLCRECAGQFFSILADKITVGLMIKSQMSALETCRIIDERRKDAAAICHA